MSRSLRSLAKYYLKYVKNISWCHSYTEKTNFTNLVKSYAIICMWMSLHVYKCTCVCMHTYTCSYTLLSAYVYKLPHAHNDHLPVCVVNVFPPANTINTNREVTYKIEPPPAIGNLWHNKTQKSTIILNIYWVPQNMSVLICSIICECLETETMHTKKNLNSNVQDYKYMSSTYIHFRMFIFTILNKTQLYHYF